MQIPQINCKIVCTCPIYKSESPEKIKQALANIFGENTNIIIEKSFAKIQSNNLEILKKIFETIRAKGNQRLYKKYLYLNLKENSTWFYLNKQAAFANTISLCSEEQESPLGPIKVSLTSSRIDDIINWLISRDQKNSS